MPSLSVSTPSFQLGLLKPTLERAGFSVENVLPYLFFEQWVTPAVAETLAMGWGSMVGEWIWSRAAFQEVGPPGPYFDAYPEELAQVCRLAHCSLEDLVRIRDEIAPDFIRCCVAQLSWNPVGVVGFSVVFQQLVASLALARGLKERFPEVHVIMGGGAFEEEIAREVMTQCPAVDSILCGEGDVAFPEMMRRRKAGESFSGLSGLFFRDADGLSGGGRAGPYETLEQSPTPDYDAYFAARRNADTCQVYTGWVPIETSRGCWWGAKNHCAFCGRHDEALRFRSKSPERVLEMLTVLAARYGCTHFNAVDDILDPSYIDQMFPRLAEQQCDLRLHYHVRANLRRSQLAALRQGGLHSLQSGVESLSTHLLHLMNKKITGMRTLEFVKWCTYYDIRNGYNLLYGFSGERAEDYADQLELLNKIVHLEPPYAITRVRADRGSPMYLAEKHRTVCTLVPSPAYRFVYPAGFDQHRVAFFFEHDAEDVLPAEVMQPLIQQVGDWQRRWQKGPRPLLRYRKLPGELHFEDGRGRSTEWYVCRGDSVALYEFCHDARKRSAIDERFKGAWVDRALEAFLEVGLLVRLDQQYLSVALPQNSYH